VAEPLPSVLPPSPDTAVAATPVTATAVPAQPLGVIAEAD